MVSLARYGVGKDAFLEYQNGDGTIKRVPLSEVRQLSEGGRINPRRVGDESNYSYEIIPVEEARRIAEERGGDYLVQIPLWRSYIILKRVAKPCN